LGNPFPFGFLRIPGCSLLSFLKHHRLPPCSPCDDPTLCPALDGRFFFFGPVANSRSPRSQKTFTFVGLTCSLSPGLRLFFSLVLPFFCFFRAARLVVLFYWHIPRNFSTGCYLLGIDCRKMSLLTGSYVRILSRETSAPILFPSPPVSRTGICLHLRQCLACFFSPRAPYFVLLAPHGLH